jgi:hypothetical protein
MSGDIACLRGNLSPRERCLSAAYRPTAIMTDICRMSRYSVVSLDRFSFFGKGEPSRRSPCARRCPRTKVLRGALGTVNLVVIKTHLSPDASCRRRIRSRPQFGDQMQISANSILGMAKCHAGAYFKRRLNGAAVHECVTMPSPPRVTSAFAEPSNSLTRANVGSGHPGVIEAA